MTGAWRSTRLLLVGVTCGLLPVRLAEAQVALGPEAWALHQAADSLEATGAFAPAVALVRAALAEEPDHPHLLYDLGRLHLLLGHTDSATASLNRSLALDSTNVAAWSDYGAALTAGGRHEEAVSSFRSALKLQPGDGTVLINLARTLLVLGRDGEAGQAIADLKASAIATPAEVYQGGELLLRYGRLADALMLYDLVAVRAPQVPNGHLRRADVLMQLGRHAEAITAFERVLALVPELAEAWGGLGQSQLTLGDSTAARTSWSRAEQLDQSFFTTGHPEWERSWHDIR